MKEEHQFDEAVLGKYRTLLFPILAEGMITGYNVYRNRIKTDAPYLVNYLHSDLGTDEHGRMQPHFKELCDCLSSVGQMDLSKIIRILQTLVCR